MATSLYRARRPRASPLWQCLQQHRQAFLEQYPVRFESSYGYLRGTIRPSMEAFLGCGDLSRGFARLHCDHCGHDYLLAFSCKERYFCPSCHQKKVQQFGEFVRHEVVRSVPHRQVVLTLPIGLRKPFQFDRRLLTDLCQAAWLSVREVMRARLGTKRGQPGMIVAIQTFGDYLGFHPHLHALVTDGLFSGERTFLLLPRTDWQQVEEAFRHRVLRFLGKKGKVRPERIERMRQWKHSGFDVHGGHRIDRSDHDALQRLAEYILRNPFSLEKMTYLPETAEVIYRSKRNYHTKRQWERFDAPAFIAAITQHIPEPRQHLVRYYGAYSNRARGERRKKLGTERPASETSLPACTSLADYVKAQELQEREDRRAAFDSGDPLCPHDDEAPPAGDDVAVIELPRDELPRLSRKKWRELILKVWEVDPMHCPRCGFLMRVDALVEDRTVAESLLRSLGWWTEAVSSDPARAPPPRDEAGLPELPFTSEHDAVVYVLEPWEQARRERVAACARERDQLAGIVEYDGEWVDDPSWQQGGKDPCWNTRTLPVTAWENECFDLPEEDYDQRPPIEWEEAEFNRKPEDSTSRQDATDPRADLRELDQWDAIDPPAPDDLPDWPAD